MRRFLWPIVVAVLLVAGVLAWRSAATRASDAMVRADPETILADPALAKTALAMGRPVFADRCASCHGAAGEPDPTRGVPDLRDDDRLYGEGRVADIEAIVRHGIRSGDRKGWNLAAMPAYARAKPYAAEPIPPLTPQGVGDVTQFVLSLSKRATDPAAVARGRALYSGTGDCWDCHSGDARGDSAIGAPDLADNVWLYGDGSAASIAASLERGRAGVSPAFAKLLTPAEIRAVSVYVASLSHDRGKQP